MRIFPIAVEPGNRQALTMKATVILPVFALAMLLTACSVYRNVDPHQIGWRCPALSAPDQYGREVNLKEAASGPWAVVFFYPKADTPG